MSRVLAAASAVFLGAAVACATSSTDIADLSVVTTLPKDVGPGGFDKTIGVDGVATGVFYKAELSDCRPMIDSVARAWAVQHALTETQRALDTRSVTLTFTSERFPDGAFAISYRLASDRASARVHVTYGGTSDKRSLSAEDLEGLGMAALIDNLLTALKCDSRGQEVSRRLVR